MIATAAPLTLRRHKKTKEDLVEEVMLHETCIDPSYSLLKTTFLDGNLLIGMPCYACDKSNYTTRAEHGAQQKAGTKH